MIKFDYIDGDELPFRVQINTSFGAGVTEQKAIMAALRVGKYIPERCKDYRRVITHLFWNYEVNDDWNIIIQKLSGG